VKAGEETRGDQLDAPATARTNLLERGAELAAVENLIDGRGRLLAVEGPPGIGKTSLIMEARTLAQEAGMQVLAARGSELEGTFAFGVVRQLFEPFLVQLPNGDRAELLEGAAALATPLFEPSQLTAESRDVSLAMLHGLYWLTANTASRLPLLLAIDDLHWCDPASLRWLAYLLPRLEGLELGLVAGLRPTEPGEDPALLAQILSDPLAIVLRPAPLSEPATGELVRETLSTADDGFCRACHEITGGNPLLLHELMDALVVEGVAPVASSVSGLSELAARAGWRAASVRLSRLPPEATQLAQAVAILGDDVDTYQAAALAGLDEAQASQASRDLARVDILGPHPPLAFVHPLLREAVYDALSPLERSNGHSRASQLLAISRAEPEAIAAHLLLVPPALGPDAIGGRMLALLREAARSARSRGATESAVAYLRRALAEAPPAEQRASLLLELGAAEALVQGDAAVEHTREAYELIEDPVLSAKTAVLLGRQLFFLHRVDESVGVFRRGIEELGGADEELDRLLQVGLINNIIFEPAYYQDGQAWLERVRGLLPAESTGEKMLLALLSYHDARAGAPASTVVPLARRALSEGTLLAKENGGGPFVCAAIVLAMADLDEVVEVYGTALSEAHRRGSTFAFAAAKAFRAQVFVYRGDLAEAEADAREARDACEAWGVVRTRLADCAGFLADALMEQGRLDEAASALARSGSEESPSESAHLHFLLDSRARLRLLRGDLEGGVEEMREASRRLFAVGGRNPAFLASRSQAALALLELGREEEARRLASEELTLARIWGAPRALGLALRVSGLVEGGEAGLVLLREAVEVLAGSPAKLEHAKARTELGAALRRANRRSQAREHLRQAVELATVCGALPLVERAETELLATGARPRRVALSGVEALTPSERRVAEMAAEGPTNREIAQALFVTQRTVEVHLTSIYRKLGISSRMQLPAALGRPAHV
jgi:DNA-binding CsgD family transcriptional regulator/tetratricopeptide (TPR) repeat protein